MKLEKNENKILLAIDRETATKCLISALNGTVNNVSHRPVHIFCTLFREACNADVYFEEGEENRIIVNNFDRTVLVLLTHEAIIFAKTKLENTLLSKHRYSGCELFNIRWKDKEYNLFMKDLMHKKYVLYPNFVKQREEVVYEYENEIA